MARKRELMNMGRSSAPCRSHRKLSSSSGDHFLGVSRMSTSVIIVTFESGKLDLVDIASIVSTLFCRLFMDYRHKV